jgi:hypothetical protein
MADWIAGRSSPPLGATLTQSYSPVEASPEREPRRIGAMIAIARIARMVISYFAVHAPL